MVVFWCLDIRVLLQHIQLQLSVSGHCFVHDGMVRQISTFSENFYTTLHQSRYSDSLRAGRSGDRIPEGRDFPQPSRPAPGAYPVSYTMGTGSFPGVKRPGRGADHPPPSKCRGQERVELYHYSPPLGLHGLLWEHLYLYLLLFIETTDCTCNNLSLAAMNYFLRVFGHAALPRSLKRTYRILQVIG